MIPEQILNANASRTFKTGAFTFGIFAALLTAAWTVFLGIVLVFSGWVTIQGGLIAQVFMFLIPTFLIIRKTWFFAPYFFRGFIMATILMLCIAGAMVANDMWRHCYTGPVGTYALFGEEDMCFR